MSLPGSRPAWRTGLFTAAVTAGTLIAATAGSPAVAVSGDPAADSSYAFTTKLDIGGKRACSGALVAPQWVITAASCFIDDPRQGTTVSAGKPKDATTVTIGSQVRDAVELVPRTDRDLVMVRLVDPVTAITPLAVSAKAPSAGEELTVAGFGRTRTEWIPDKLHTATFTAGAVKATTVDLAAKSAGAAICKGDTGGPAWRTDNGKPALVAVNSRSWQGGCLGESETRTGAQDVRVDDIGDWIREVGNRGYPVLDANGRANFSETAAADFNKDGKADLVARDSTGSLFLWKHDSGDALKWPSFLSSGWNYTQTTAADFTGDGKADLVARDGNGDLYLWAGDGNGGFGRPVKLTGGWNYTQTTAADFTGDGKADLVARDGNGDLYLWAGDGNGGFGRPVKLTGGWNYTQTTAADFTGDGKADLVARDDNGDLYLWAGDGNGGFGRPVKLTGGW
ncbi:FG-GAP-like repeat-containing protein [Kitasatospora sp. NPDC001175]